MAQTVTQESFSGLLMQYAPNALFYDESIKRNWFFTNVEHDTGWLGGELVVPFQGGKASSVRAGSLTPIASITSSKYVKGIISVQPEVWGSMIFREKDLMRHGKISEQNFLKLLPREIEDFLQTMKDQISMMFTNGARFSSCNAVQANLATGVLVVDRVERFVVGQMVRISDNDNYETVTQGFIHKIDVNANTITVYDLPLGTAGAVVVDLAAAGIEAAKAIRVYLDGFAEGDNQLSSLKLGLLSATNSGSSTLYGQTKVDYPYLQSINISGSAFTAATFIDDVFAAQTVVRNKGKGMPTTILCSYYHLGLVMAGVELQKGAYSRASEMKASLFGWSEIVINGVTGSLKFVAVQEMDNDWMAIVDMGALKIYSNGGLKKRVSPEGQEYFVVRDEATDGTGGYKYVVDMCFMGDMVLEAPSKCGIIHSIPTTL